MLDNFSKEIRDTYKKVFDLTKRFAVIIRTNAVEDEEYISYVVSEIISVFVVPIINKAENLNRNNVMFLSILKQMYTDLYKRLNYLEKIDLIEESEKEILNTLKSINSVEELLEFSNNQKNSYLLSHAIMRFNDLSVYDKVLEIKALSKEDVDVLIEFNPFFEIEYNSLNVKIDENFIARQIKKWQRIFKNDISKSYRDASFFIEKYSILDSNLKEKIITTYKGENLEKVLEDFYLTDGVHLTYTP